MLSICLICICSHYHYRFIEITSQSINSSLLNACPLHSRLIIHILAGLKQIQVIAIIDSNSERFVLQVHERIKNDDVVADWQQIRLPGMPADDFVVSLNYVN